MSRLMLFFMIIIARLGFSIEPLSCASNVLELCDFSLGGSSQQSVSYTYIIDGGISFACAKICLLDSPNVATDQRWTTFQNTPVTGWKWIPSFFQKCVVDYGTFGAILPETNEIEKFYVGESKVFILARTCNDYFLHYIASPCSFEKQLNQMALAIIQDEFGVNINEEGVLRKSLAYYENSDFCIIKITFDSLNDIDFGITDTNTLRWVHGTPSAEVYKNTVQFDAMSVPWDAHDLNNCCYFYIEGAYDKSRLLVLKSFSEQYQTDVCFVRFRPPDRGDLYLPTIIPIYISRPE